MAPELRKAAERIFCEGFKAAGRGMSLEIELAWWRTQQPGYRPIGKAPELAAPYSGSSAPQGDAYEAVRNALVEQGYAIATFNAPDPTPSYSPDTSSSDFSGGGGGDFSGGGSSGDY